MFATLVRVEHVVLLRSLSSVPAIHIGHFQISSFFYVFISCEYPVSLFFSAGWPYDLCRIDKMMRLGPISLNQDSTHASHSLMSTSAIACFDVLTMRSSLLRRVHYISQAASLCVHCAIPCLAFHPIPR